MHGVSCALRVTMSSRFAVHTEWMYTTTRTQALKGGCRGGKHRCLCSIVWVGEQQPSQWCWNTTHTTKSIPFRPAYYTIKATPSWPNVRHPILLPRLVLHTISANYLHRIQKHRVVRWLNLKLCIHNHSYATKFSWRLVYQQACLNSICILHRKFKRNAKTCFKYKKILYFTGVNKW